MTHYDFKKIMKESLPILSFCIILEVMGGNLLDGKKSDFFEMPIIFVLIPVINGIGGNLGTIFGSRLSSGLHLGYIKLSLEDKNLRTNIRLSFLVGVFIFGVMTMLIWLLAPLIGVDAGELGFWEFVAIALLSGILITVIAILVSIITAFVSFRRGIDPDNVVTPLVTTFGDISGIILVIVFVIIIT